MTQQRPTDEDLMAYADGALAPAEAERMARLVAADPALQETVEMFRRTSDLVRAARGPLAGAPVPDPLRQSIEQMIANAAPPVPTPAAENVVPFQPKPNVAASSRQRPWAMPVAASLLALLGGVAGYLAGQTGPQQAEGFAAVGKPLPAEIGTALASIPSGSATTLQAGTLRVIASVRSKAGSLCREFEVDNAAGQTVAGIGCRDDGGWRLDIAVAAPPTQDGYAPASSLNAIDSYLGTIEAGEPLSAADEAAALSTAD